MENYESVFIALGIISLASLLSSIVIVPLVIAHLPSDYFTRPATPLKELSLTRLLARGMKNLLGILFLLAGFVMLFIPGQGILTILLGLSLVEFPGKQRRQVQVLQSSRVQRLVQWCRKKAGREPLLIPQSQKDPSS